MISAKQLALNHMKSKGYEVKDKSMDKKKGIKEGSKKDKSLDSNGMKPSKLEKGRKMNKQSMKNY